MAADSDSSWWPAKVIARAIALCIPLAVAALASGCEKKLSSVLTPNLRPFVKLSAAPLPQDSVFYAVTFRWFAFDEDGQVTHVIYAVDPSAEGDTAWVRSDLGEVTLLFRSSQPRDPLPANEPVASSDYHVFVIKAVDNDGLTSAPVFRAFTSYTVAPETQIQFPRASRLLPAVTHPNVTIQWTGKDPDGVTTQVPILYRHKISSEQTIKLALGLGNFPLTPGNIQTFFSEAGPTFASWDSLPPDSTFKEFEGLTPGQTWYFAVVAFDEAGAYEPRFLLGNNVLRFLPTTNLSPPRITVSNSFFFFEQPSGGFRLDERDVVRIDFVSGAAIRFKWFAEIETPGTKVAGFRWVLDPPDQDITDETPRERDDQTWRWSTWSLNETSATIGPFKAEPEEPRSHRFYLEARDNAGLISIVIIEIRVLAPILDRPLLIIDDFRSNRDRIINDDPDDPLSFQPFGPFPTEAVSDTLFYAVGNVPYRHRPPGTLSQPGMFAGFDYDTLDYSFIPSNGIPLEILFKYEGVAIYTGLADAARDRLKGTSDVKLYASALRVMNTSGHLNSLAVYLSQGGKVWIFGDGAVLAIIRGSVAPFARYPITPLPGSFLYEFLKARSLVDAGERTGNRLVGGTPYLPQFATLGRTWPPETYDGPRGSTDDPRVGPSAERLLPRWEGLPFLSPTTEFLNWPTPMPTKFDLVAYLATPNSILEELSPGSGVDPVSTLDTLYLFRAKLYTPPSQTFPNSDGQPMMFSYWGNESGPVVWSGIPLWQFERTQLRELATVVLGNLGFTRKPDPTTWTGPGSAHIHFSEAPTSLP